MEEDDKDKTPLIVEKQDLSNMENQPEIKQNFCISISLAIAAALCFGTANFILATIGFDLGIKTFYPFCISSLILFLGYHLFIWIKFCC